MRTRRRGYDTALCAGMAVTIGGAASGDVYISCDRNGSLGKDPKFGKIVRANAVVAQGFQTSVFTLKDGKAQMGFVTKEEGDAIELRDIAGQVTGIKRSEVKAEKALPQSMMPPGLGNTLSIGDFKDPIEYLMSPKNVGV